MTVLELLSLYRPLFSKMTRNGISSEDIMYIDVVKEYNKMLEDGQKAPQIRAFLAKKYKLSPKGIKTAEERLNEEYDL